MLVTEEPIIKYVSLKEVKKCKHRLLPTELHIFRVFGFSNFTCAVLFGVFSFSPKLEEEGG